MASQSEPMGDRRAVPVLQEAEAEVRAHAHHDRGLLAIGLFKLGKALLFFSLGIGAIHLLHKDLGDEILRLAKDLKFDPESRIVTLILNKADLIDDHRLKLISLGTFAYSVLALAEGIGLMLEKAWAEYLTLLLTISFLPWELYELSRHLNWFRLTLLLINLAVLWYLVLLLKKKSETNEATRGGRTRRPS
ncbi:DUF2127 domain-containing protein [Edaphobacter aggregans]|uniref:DUF2127 domain-containing protein n=1 Tax=Edaphobacter aggregans TaxID=570835 RepID=UPI001FE0C263|nr:DUF2127 domain-containing protein [Edaphobacter aggregans]